jgi:hypothetical protein
LEARGPWERLAEDQASAVVKRFERLGIEILEGAPLASGLGCGTFGWPAPRMLPDHAVETATGDELGVLRCVAHSISFLELTDNLSQE